MATAARAQPTGRRDPNETASDRGPHSPLARDLVNPRLDPGWEWERRRSCTSTPRSRGPGAGLPRLRPGQVAIARSYRRGAPSASCGTARRSSIGTATSASHALYMLDKFEECKAQAQATAPGGGSDKRASSAPTSDGGCTCRGSFGSHAELYMEDLDIRPACTSGAESSSGSPSLESSEGSGRSR